MGVAFALAGTLYLGAPACLEVRIVVDSAEECKESLSLWDALGCEREL